MKKIRIGSGAGYAGDRIEPAVELMEKGNLDYIIFCLLYTSDAADEARSRTKRKIRRRVTTSYSTTEWKKFSR